MTSERRNRLVCDAIGIIFFFFFIYKFLAKCVRIEWSKCTWWSNTKSDDVHRCCNPVRMPKQKPHRQHFTLIYPNRSGWKIDFLRNWNVDDGLRFSLCAHGSIKHYVKVSASHRPRETNQLAFCTMYEVCLQIKSENNFFSTIFFLCSFHAFGFHSTVYCTCTSIYGRHLFECGHRPSCIQQNVNMLKVGERHKNHILYLLPHYSSSAAMVYGGRSRSTNICHRFDFLIAD